MPARQVPQPRLIEFDRLASVTHDLGVEDAEASIGGKRWAMVSYSPGSGRADWCEAPHLIFVLSGSVTYEFEDDREVIKARAGDGVYLPAYPRHRGSSPGSEGARMFVIDAEMAT